MTDIQKEPKKQELIESNNEDEELNAFFDRINSRNSKCVVLCMDTIGEYLKDLNEREKLSLNVNENKTELNKKVESQKCAWKPASIPPEQILPVKTKYIPPSQKLMKYNEIEFPTISGSTKLELKQREEELQKQKKINEEGFVESKKPGKYLPPSQRKNCKYAAVQPESCN